MFEFLAVFALVVLGLAAFSATARILLHVIFRPDIPPSLQRLANAFDDVFEISAATILGPLRFLRQDQVPTSPQPPTLPQTDARQLTKQ